MTDDTPRDPLAAIYAEHRECGKPKYDGCFAHFPSPHCRADGYPWPCDVDRIRTIAVTRPSGDEALLAVPWWPLGNSDRMAKLDAWAEKYALATPSSTPDVEGLEALQRGIQAGVRRRLLAGAIGRIYTPTEVATMVGLAVDEQMERLAALATPSSTPDVEGVEMGLDVERLARALRFQFSRECLPDRDADFRAACIADDYAAARENKPPTTDEIAAQEGLKPESLRQALRESHPDASPSEVIGRAHDIEENT